MKPSRFNAVYAIDGSRKAIYNTRTGRVVAVPAAAADVVEKARQAPLLLRHGLAAADRANLAAAGAIVPDDADELQAHIYQSERTRFAGHTTRVLVLTTRACNLRCHYCYQGSLPRDSRMTPQRAAAAARFVQQMITDRRSRAASVGFYGGEPLLNVDACVRVMEPLAAFAASRGMHIEFPVTTNGSRLARLRSERFFELVSSVHVTIEGDRPIHDQIRRTVDGHGSYDAILAGLVRVVQKEIRVIVRVHENDLTGERFVRILDDLAGAGLRPDNATIYLTGAAPPVSQSDLDQCRRNLGEHRLRLLGSEEALAGAVGDHALAPAIRWDMTRPTTPLPQANGGCVFGGASSLAIDANGDLYKCPDDLRPSARIGVLDEKGIAHWTARYFKLLSGRWWRDGHACTACEWLPVCGAGCPLMTPPASLEDCSIRRQWFASSARHYVEHCLQTV